MPKGTTLYHGSDTFHWGDLSNPEKLKPWNPLWASPVPAVALSYAIDHSQPNDPAYFSTLQVDRDLRLACMDDPETARRVIEIVRENDIASGEWDEDDDELPSFQFDAPVPLSDSDTLHPLVRTGETFVDEEGEHRFPNYYEDNSRVRDVVCGLRDPSSGQPIFDGYYSGWIPSTPPHEPEVLLCRPYEVASVVRSEPIPYRRRDTAKIRALREQWNHAINVAKQNDWKIQG